jgi:membrane protease YdiL (CAAX protease family)
LILVIYAFFIKGSPWLDGSAEKISEVMKSFGVTSIATYCALGLFISFGNSLVEEYYWRWFLFGQMKRFLSFPIAALISSLGFAGHHFIFLINNLSSAPVAFLAFLTVSIVIGGIMWCYQYHLFKSITAPFISHIIIDLGLIVLGYDLIFAK